MPDALSAPIAERSMITKKNFLPLALCVPTALSGCGMYVPDKELLAVGYSSEQERQDDRPANLEGP